MLLWRVESFPFLIIFRKHVASACSMARGIPFEQGLLFDACRLCILRYRGHFLREIYSIGLCFASCGVELSWGCFLSMLLSLSLSSMTEYGRDILVNTQGSLFALVGFSLLSSLLLLG